MAEPAESEKQRSGESSRQLRDELKQCRESIATYHRRVCELETELGSARNQLVHLQQQQPDSHSQREKHLLQLLRTSQHQAGELR